MTQYDAILALLSFGPVSFVAGLYVGNRYPWLILGRNRDGRSAH